MIDTSTFGSSTPSLVTARAGGSTANTFWYSSFIPAKSALPRNPALHFELVDVLATISGLTIVYH
ncbi:MAG: hypothetical protein ACXV4D_07060, partial [Ilumatobacteraceae bacterium]